jgi:CO dehydrogenase nickel-insertion accessory protein CooC1
VFLEFLVEQPHFQHVADACLDLDQIKGLADEIPCAGQQCAQLVSWLCGYHQHGQVTVGGVGFEALHHLESVHFRHLQIEQDQVVGVLAVQRAHLLGIHACESPGVAGLKQHLFKQEHIGRLVVHDEDAGVEHVGRQWSCGFLGERVPR